MRSYAKYPSYVVSGLEDEKGFREKPVPQPVTDGLIFYVDSTNPKSYPGDGTTWTDLDTTVNATLTNSPAYSPAWNGVLTFDGTDDYAAIPYASSPFRQSVAITYDFWMRVTTGGYAIGTSISGGQGSGGFQIFPSIAYFQWTPTEPNSDRQVQAFFNDSTANAWKHICFTYTFANVNSYQFYENGVPIVGTMPTADITNAVPRTQYDVSVDDRIGGRSLNGTGYFVNASIPIVRMYNRAITAGEVWNNFNYDRKKFGL
jgi:hypothetical protein